MLSQTCLIFAKDKKYTCIIDTQQELWNRDTENGDKK